MSFFRPEAVAWLRRWGVPAVLALVGCLLVLRGLQSGLTTISGLVQVTLGVFACLALFGEVERALMRWRGQSGGPGVIVAEEGRISYLGPETGGVVEIDNLVSVEILTTAKGPLEEDLYWVLADGDGQQLIIPGGAEGSGALLNALAALSNFDHMAVMRAMGSTEEAYFSIWQRPLSDDSRIVSRP